MSALDPVAAGTDPFTRTAQTFPTFSAEQLTRVRAFGTEEAVPAGALLFSRGERGVDVFVVLGGSVDIYETGADGREQVFVTYGAGQFTGELDRLTDRQVLVSARAASDSDVLRITRAGLRRLLVAEPDIAETMLRAFILRRVGLIWHSRAATLLVGPRHDAHTLRLQRFLSAHSYPYRVVDTEQPNEASPLRGLGPTVERDLPLVVLPGGQLLRRPSNAALAEILGLTEPRDVAHVHDVAVVGAGPAGLAAAVYAASEGLDTCVIEAEAPGGQAGSSSRIENYLGFPTGISGQALAGRAQVQAQKFGAHMIVPRRVVRVDCRTTTFRLELDDGTTVAAHVVVAATGARYRRLVTENYDRFEGAGIHYAATAMEAQLCSGEPVAVVGAGNSAGQAALYLSRYAAHVFLVVRGATLAATMSRYLIERIEAASQISVHLRSEVETLQGEKALAAVGWIDRATGARSAHPVRNLFVMIGAEPNTSWLRDCVDLDSSGFVLTGARQDVDASPYATSRRGVFAIGDARAGSVKRVAAGVGEGAGVVHAIHRYLSA